MRAIRAKKIRHAMKILMKHHGDTVAAASQEKANMPNRHGALQHWTINLVRQLKRMVIREGIA